MSTAVDAGPQGTAPIPTSDAPGTAAARPSGGSRWGMLALILLSALTGLWGVGLLGGRRVEETSSGWLAPDATWVSPAAPAFAIWGLVFLGLLAYGVWQLGDGAWSARHAVLRPWLVAAVGLVGLWLVAAQLDLLWGSALAAVALVVVLFRVLALLESRPVRGAAERVLVDGVFGLLLGWMTLMALVDVVALAGSFGWTGAPLMPTTWAGIVIVVATVIGALTAVYSGGRLAPALGLAWGLLWLGVGRQDGTGLLSGSVALTAWGCAAIVLLCWLAALALSRRSATGEARDLILDALDGGDDPVDGIR